MEHTIIIVRYVRLGHGLEEGLCIVIVLEKVR